MNILALLPSLILVPRFCWPLNAIPFFLAILIFLSLTNFNAEFTISSQPTIHLEIGGFNSSIVTLSLLITYLILIVSLNINGPRSISNNVWVFIFTAYFLLTTIVFFFLTDNILTLYIIFELSLIPTLVIILNWGYQPERLQASFYFVLYTICASLPLLYIILFKSYTSFSYSIIYSSILPSTNLCSYLSTMCFLIAFLVKLPIWGVHLWLPNAHVEAPVSGSMVLAGILLNLGGYGLLKVITLNQGLDVLALNLFIGINLWGALAISLVCLSHIDINVIVAYSSIVHINLIVLGILSNSQIGIWGAIYIIIAHAISSPAIFSLANTNYLNTHTRNILLQNGMGPTQPQTNIAWFIIISANIAAPPTLNLISEIIITTSILNLSSIFILPLIMVTILSGAYNLYIFSSQQGSAQNNSPFYINTTSSELLLTMVQVVITSIVIFIAPFII